MKTARLPLVGYFAASLVATFAISLPASAITVTQSVDPTVIAMNGTVQCGDSVTGMHSENSYYRVFDLSKQLSKGVVTGVRLAIERADGGPQPILVRLWRLDGPLTLANMTAVASTDVMVENQAFSFLEVALPTPAPFEPAAPLVLEIFTPDGQSSGHIFFLGANGLGQTALSGCPCIQTTCLWAGPTGATHALTPRPSLSRVMRSSSPMCSTRRAWFPGAPT